MNPMNKDEARAICMELMKDVICNSQHACCNGRKDCKTQLLPWFVVGLSCLPRVFASNAAQQALKSSVRSAHEVFPESADAESADGFGRFV